MAKHAPECHPASKWAIVLGDRLFPMPRRKLTARDILDQTGTAKEFVLVRDYESPHDVAFDDNALVDLADGNVFLPTPRCEATPQRHCAAPAKLAFVCDDLWEVTLIGQQTGHSLKRLLGLPDDAELLRDFESPNDQPIRDEETTMFADGPVFTARRLTLTVKVNNQPVHFTTRRVTGLNIKQTAIEQGVKIDIGCVLYRLKPDGSLGPAIRDDEPVVLKHGDAFNCVAPDDNS
ncbi:MAG: hypothetical protein HZA88_04785 [Verrucomicrobia bacterium]|nr:hypothetical protein [Verrucomicrobiota bacterium]